MVWGCPPFALVDGPLRAAKAAIDLYGSLSSLLEGTQHTLAMGLTTGRAFAGNVGSAARCEYSVLGNSINMAARCGEKSGTLCCSYWGLILAHRLGLLFLCLTACYAPASVSLSLPLTVLWAWPTSRAAAS